ncbi:uncharacterized protein [Euwallacea fornicatus]|uniref:uncharacterized protein n=1 Tax=Euwallacea fornicatus TaxID=995702 RepID=UPI00338FC464
MVYVKSDGTVCYQPPIHERVLRFIFGAFSFVIFFFKSLVGMETNKSGASRSGSSFFGGGSGGGGSGPHGPGGGPKFRTMRDVNPPTVKGVGSCPGGGCGM